MNHEDAFLQSITDEPDDDTPRLIFADWLDENGDPQRAQFIRVQCRLAKLGEHDPERYRLQDEEAALLPEMTKRLTDRQHPRWAGSLGRWLKDQRPAYERGFVTRLGTTPKRFFDHAANLMKAAPIQHLTLNNVGPRLNELLASPYLPRIRSLSMTHQRLGDGAIAALVGSPAVANLTNLDLLRNRFRIEGAASIANSPHLGKLERLALNLNRIHDRGPEALAASPHLTSLKRLEMSDCQVGPRGATALARSPHLGKLEWLDLSNNRISDAGAQALADAASMGNVTHLNVSRNLFSPDGLRALLQNVGLKRLTALWVNVYGAPIGGAFWRIEPSAHLRGRLELRAEFYEEVRTNDLPDSPLLAACAGLTITGGFSGDTTALALAGTSAVSSLRALELVNCDLQDKGMLALANSPHLKNLRRLSLAQNNRISRAGIQALVKAPLLRRLTHLDLSTWHVGDDVLKAFAEAQGLEQLVRLRLSHAPMGRWRTALRERLGWRVVFE